MQADQHTSSTVAQRVSSEQVNASRQLESQVVGQAVMDGAGVKIKRVLSQSLQQRLDPFLMLDAFGSDEPNDYLAGFPNHPHRGFETVTYMIAGRMRHRDSAGHEGLLENGGVQWMSAGRGLIHSELPEQSEGRMEGFQLWLNLPAAAKMSAPWYQDIPASEIPVFQTEDGVRVQVIAGASHDVSGAIQRPVTEPLYLDIHLPAGGSFQQALPSSQHSFVYVYRGEITIGQQSLSAGRLGILDNQTEHDGLSLSSAAGAKVLLLSAQPLNEPIVQHGPFVMNTQTEIEQAMRDYRDGLMG